MTGLALLIGVALAGGRHRCTLAAELGFEPVPAGERAWVALLRPVGWDTQDVCPREPLTVRFTTMPGVDPTALPADRLPVFHYQHSEEPGPRGPMVLDLWAMVGSTAVGGTPSGCEIDAQVMMVKANTPPRLLVRPTEPLEALGCPIPGRPFEITVDPGMETGLTRGDTLRIRRKPESMRWAVLPPSTP